MVVSLQSKYGQWVSAVAKLNINSSILISISGFRLGKDGIRDDSEARDRYLQVYYVVSHWLYIVT